MINNWFSQIIFRCFIVVDLYSKSFTSSLNFCTEFGYNLEIWLYRSSRVVLYSLRHRSHTAQCPRFAYMFEGLNSICTVRIKLMPLVQSKPQRVDSKLQLCHKLQGQYHQENSFGRLCYLSAFQGECHFWYHRQ